MGHEAIGVVEAVGSDVRTLHVGDTVIVPFAWSDGTCASCRDGLTTSCVHGGFSDGAASATQAEKVLVPFADGTAVVVPAGTDEALMPSLLTLSDVYLTGSTPPSRAGWGRARPSPSSATGPWGCPRSWPRGSWAPRRSAHGSPHRPHRPRPGVPRHARRGGARRGGDGGGQGDHGRRGYPRRARGRRARARRRAGGRDRPPGRDRVARGGAAGRRGPRRVHLGLGQERRSHGRAGPGAGPPRGGAAAGAGRDHRPGARLRPDHAAGGHRRGLPAGGPAAGARRPHPAGSAQSSARTPSR